MKRDDEEPRKESARRLRLRQEQQEQRERLLRDLDHFVWQWQDDPEHIGGHLLELFASGRLRDADRQRIEDILWSCGGARSVARSEPSWASRPLRTA